MSNIQRKKYIQVIHLFFLSELNTRNTIAFPAHPSVKASLIRVYIMRSIGKLNKDSLKKHRPHYEMSGAFRLKNQEIKKALLIYALICPKIRYLAVPYTVTF